MPERRALIFANGLIPSYAAAKRLVQPGDALIAADGGARHLAALGLTPHVVIGDLDSLSPAEIEHLRGAGARILQFPREKDETDLELAILHACREGYTHLRILGAFGGRFDQALANLFLLALPELKGIDARLDDGLEEAFLIESNAFVEGRPGEVVSLLPLGSPAGGIRTRGLRYPLRAETLYPERSRGISNELEAPIAEIRLEQGRLICIHTRKGGSNDETL